MKKTLFIAFVFLGMFSSVWSQEKKIAKAHTYYENYAYIEAIAIYSELVESGTVTTVILKNLANAYYFNAKYSEAAKWYQQFFEHIEGKSPSIYFLRYSQSLRATGKNKMAAKWYNKYFQRINLGNNFSIESYLSFIQKNSGRYHIKNLKINTDEIDFGGGVHKGNLIYASTKRNGLLAPKSSWEGLHYLNLFAANIIMNDFLEMDSIGSSKKIEGKINTKFHESSACFSANGKTMYFTRSNVSPVEISKGKAQKLKIYRAVWKNGEWTEVEDLSINNDFYSNAHPTLNADETKLYFVSDRPGGYGETDLYVVEILQNGDLGMVRNLGGKVNTLGRETFPFITTDNELYFSSNGHYGLGGLDVFYINLNDQSADRIHIWNVGKPINSSADDFAFTIDNKSKKGFFSSDRQGEHTKGYSDIYSFVEIRKINDTIIFQMRVDVSNAETANIPIKKSEPKITISENRKKKSTNKITPKKIKPGKDVAQILDVTLYFGFDESKIDSQAMEVLKKIMIFMKKHPEIKISIRSHTDSRGSDSYNMQLSEKRAKSTMQSLIDQGISKNRLIVKGYGETRLVNNCSNSIPCAEEEHRNNRRSEFIVVE